MPPTLMPRSSATCLTGVVATNEVYATRTRASAVALPQKESPAVHCLTAHSQADTIAQFLESVTGGNGLLDPFSAIQPPSTVGDLCAIPPRPISKILNRNRTFGKKTLPVEAFGLWHMG